MASDARSRYPELGQRIHRPRAGKADLVKVQKPDRAASA